MSERRIFTPGFKHYVLTKKSDSAKALDDLGSGSGFCQLCTQDRGFQADNRPLTQKTVADLSEAPLLNSEILNICCPTSVALEESKPTNEPSDKPSEYLKSASISLTPERRRELKFQSPSLREIWD